MRNSILRMAIFAVLLLFSELSRAGTHTPAVIYRYPLPNSVEVHPRTDIGIRAASAYDANIVGNAGELQSGVVIAEGSRSGRHDVELSLSRDRQVLIAHPLQPFAYDERVFVRVEARLLGGAILTDTFTFTTMRRAIPNVPPHSELGPFSNVKPGSVESTLDEETDPPITVSVDNGATPGTIYLANYCVTGADTFSYLLNLDEHGRVARKRRLPSSYALDFKEQPSGMRTYFDYAAMKYYGMDTAWNIVDSFEVKGGLSDDSYQADDHELCVFPDRGYALFAVTRSSLDQSQWAPNIDTVAVIQSSVIQMFDVDRKEIFEWRGYDHYRIADAVHEDLSSNWIDFQHANSLDFDSLGNIILSNRNLSEITKIDGKTGNIIWRFGGAHNQFRLIGDSVWFSYQHAARLLPNGHLTLFDNGNYDSVEGHTAYLSGYLYESRAVEYALDTAAMTATLVWQWHHTPETFSQSMGYVERLPDGNTLISWGWSVYNGLAVTEVKPDNSTAFEMSMGDGNYSYRAIKYPASGAPGVSSSVTAPIASGTSFEVQSSLAGPAVSAEVSVSRDELISLAVYDILGHEVSPGFSSMESAGQHSIMLPLGGLPSGAYYCVLHLADGSTIARPFTLAR